MKDANRAPMFAVMYHGLADVARKHGYALAIHGSLVADLDLVAVPWTADAISAETLREVLMSHIGACGYGDMLRREGYTDDFVEQVLANQDKVQRHDGAELKPHGRIAWNLWIGAGAKVDLSVMPRTVQHKRVEKPVGALTGREEILVDGRWVCAATFPAYDNNATYEWRIPS